MSVLLRFADVEAADWDAVVEAASETWAFHRHAWVACEGSRFASQNLSFAVADDQGLAAIVPLYYRRLPRVNWIELVVDSGHHRVAGPAYRPGLTAKAARKLERRVLDEIEQRARRLRAHRILLGQQNLAPAYAPGAVREVPSWIMAGGYRQGMYLGSGGDCSAPGLAVVAADQIVDLRRREDELKAGLADTCRRAVRKAEKAGLTLVVDAETPADAYHELALKSAARTGEAVPAVEYYREVSGVVPGEGGLIGLFAEREGRRIAGLLLLGDGEGSHFFAGASDPEELAHRPNDFLHWHAILEAKQRGRSWYRLGPTFPELPGEWPVSKVSRFKGKFGGLNIPIIQGSRYLRPEEYQDEAERSLAVLCEEPAPAPPGAMDLVGLENVLRTYGLMIRLTGPGRKPFSAKVHDVEAGAILELGSGELAGVDGLVSRPLAPRTPLFEPGSGSFFRRPPVAYRNLYPATAFCGDGVEALWEAEGGDAVIATRRTSHGRSLLVGLRPVDEYVLRTQGDPSKVGGSGVEESWGFNFERPVYLFRDMVEKGIEREPLADRLGWLLSETLSRLTGAPLVSSLPGGAKGGVLLTGDDDQALLETYDRQREVLGDHPITYILHPLTRHSPETLAKLGGPAEFGIHPDALEEPGRYFELCTEQSAAMRDVCGAPARTIRNHGFLNDGYWGHLAAWEANDLRLDSNIPGIDGTALNGSFLPLPVRRPDGSWSRNRTLLTTIGDGILYIFKMKPQAGKRLILTVADEIAARGPGIVCLNLHPQNIETTIKLHEAVLELSARPGWVPLMGDQLTTFLDRRDGVELRRAGEGFILEASEGAPDLEVRVPAGDSHWKVVHGGAWSGDLAV